jgi:hypothetical protein
MHGAAGVFYKYWKQDEDCRPFLLIIVTGAMLVPEIIGNSVFEVKVLLHILDEVRSFAPVYGLRLSSLSRGKSYHV